MHIEKRSKDEARRGYPLSASGRVLLCAAPGADIRRRSDVHSVAEIPKTLNHKHCVKIRATPSRRAMHRARIEPLTQ
jgi:hypothetical protein